MQCDSDLAGIGQDGRHWAIQDTAGPPSGGKDGDLPAVRCPSVQNCTAVGAYTGAGGFGKTLAEHWNGSRWVLQHTPNPAS